MKLLQNWLRVLGRIAMGICLPLSLTACGEMKENWSEEVALSDGRIIVVEREIVRERGGDEWALNRSGTKPKEYRIRFKNSDISGEMVEWLSTKKSPGTWPEHPLILDRESGQFVVFSTVFNSGGCHIYSKYLFKNGVWVEEALPQKFPARTSNLLIHDYKDRPGFINLATKRKRNADVTADAFIRVGPMHPYCR